MIAVYLRTLRSAADLTQHQAGKQGGVVSKTVERWEAGGAAGSIESLIKYTTALGGSALRVLAMVLGSPMTEAEAEAAAHRDREHQNDPEIERMITAQIAQLSGDRRATAIKMLRYLLESEERGE